MFSHLVPSLTPENVSKFGHQSNSPNASRSRLTKVEPVIRSTARAESHILIHGTWYSHDAHE